MKKFTIKKGRHFCRPRVFRMRRKPTCVTWQAAFGMDAKYNHEDVDQDDWNKLCGIYFNFFNTRDNTAMIGWRWNLDEQAMELNAYYHLNKERVFTPPLFDVALGEVFTASITCNWRESRYEVRLDSLDALREVVHFQPFEIKRKLSFEINTYFGGNKRAPHNITVYKTLP